uniref:Uncharacterized protein n=2 Tax=Spumella elongata TaxID=89044 RepID=A0A7S3GZ18_9STRA|mmetsp:Transcript_26606/g.45577  ORF Transcript_26606/g.45577 Transcript_26606/m.45577 type:complete len:1115 (+) Transcript_26606:60-3404(+)|eukprot:CAMPEP_0185007978 /NCGR_PEP_ID=MMETSP1098-20130426/88545_1 /TAXON_ID=89044 /ORGANISM="Spumella elongata, Strain CCAP 955/1" /LENGTH=1114 /DNA_ID=CAMNT_0027536393 /DNA_START=60 /DNA_END=3404 /DNA_ORIENTATION=-
MIQEANPLKPLIGHKGAVLCCCVHGEFLVTAGHDKKIIVWDAAKSTIQREITAHDHIISSLEVSPCQNQPEVFILSASWDKTVKVWKLRNGQLVSTFVRHENRVKCVKVVPQSAETKSSPTSHSTRTFGTDTFLAVSGDDDGHIFVWDVHSARALLVLDEHARTVVSLALYFDASLNATCLVSASVDATIRLWDLSEVSLNTIIDTANANNSKVPTQSSICAIKTPSKYISCLVTATMSSSAPLITGTDASGTTYTNKTSTTSTTNTAGVTSTFTKTETILLAADTLGSIYIYRASTGTLLIRLETKCKIISLFTTHYALDSPCFPNQHDMSGYYTGATDTKKNNDTEFVTSERNELLLHYANMKRQHNIVNAVAHRSHHYDSTNTTVAKYLYYVPDNGSTGCFCLLPESLLDVTDVTNSIALTHTLSLSLCQSLDTLYSGGSTRRSGSSGSVCESIPRKNIQLQTNNMHNNMHNNLHLSSSADYRNLQEDDNCSVGSLTSVAKRKPLAHSKTDPTSSNTANVMLKSSTMGAINSYSEYHEHSVNVSGNVSLNNSGKLSAASSGKALQAFNSSATPNSSKTRRISTRASTLTNTTTGTGKKYTSSGGVMSVSINTTEPIDNILLQCFAMSSAPIRITDSQHSHHTNHYMVFGGRDSVLFYCAYKPSATKIQPSVAESSSFTPGAPLSLVIPRPAMLSMTDILTPSQSPIDLSSKYQAINTSSSKKSGSHSSASSPSTHKAFSPVPSVYTPKIGDNMHSSPYKPDNSGSARFTSAKSADFAPNGTVKRSFSTDSGDVVDSPAVSTTLADTKVVAVNTHTELTVHSGRTLPELIDENLADLEDEMSLSEVSHIHHYYNDILSGRLTQRPDDVVKSAKSKTHLSTMVRASSTEDSDYGITTENAISEDYKGSMLEYLHTLDKQHSTSHITLTPPIRPTAKVPYHPANHTHGATHSNNYSTYSNVSINSNCKPTLLVSGYASIVGNSSMDTGFWEAANTAKSKYSFGRIRLQSHNNSSNNNGSDHNVGGNSVHSNAYSVQRLLPTRAIGANAVSNTATVSNIIQPTLSLQASDPTLVNRAAEFKRSMAGTNAEQNQPRVYKMGTVRPSHARKSAYNKT